MWNLERNAWVHDYRAKYVRIKENAWGLVGLQNENRHLLGGSSYSPFTFKKVRQLKALKSKKSPGDFIRWNSLFDTAQKNEVFYKGFLQ